MIYEVTIDEHKVIVQARSKGLALAYAFRELKDVLNGTTFTVAITEGTKVVRA